MELGSRLEGNDPVFQRLAACPLRCQVAAQTRIIVLPMGWGVEWVRGL